jgi:protein-histidine N-methyltransferase
MTASSRIFGIVIGETKTDAFVPLADMLNHKRPKQTSWYYSNEFEGFIIESLEDIQRGEQVYDSYGRKCNSRFFLNYGFINMNNDANEVALKVSYDPNDEQLPLKEKLLGDTPSTKTFRVLANVEEENTVEFMNFIRFTEIKDKISILEVMVCWQ